MEMGPPKMLVHSHISLSSLYAPYGINIGTIAIFATISDEMIVFA